jgi:regulator of nonsense transcripts 2
LEKYMSEIVTAIMEAKLAKSPDVLAAVEICSLLHQRFAEFSPLLLDSLIKQLGPPPTLSGMSAEQREREESGRLSRQKATMRLLSELYIVGVAPSSLTTKDDIISRLLGDMVCNTCMRIYTILKLSRTIVV